MAKDNEIKLKLSGATIRFTEHLSGKADTIFTEQHDKGLVLGSSETGKTVVKEIHNVKIKKAYEQVFPYIVEAVYEKGDDKALPEDKYQNFLESIPVADFNQIRVHFDGMKEYADKLLGDAKK